jgi:hypothetical protein
MQFPDCSNITADYRSSLARLPLIGWSSKCRPIKFIDINQSTGFPLLLYLGTY